LCLLSPGLPRGRHVPLLGVVRVILLPLERGSGRISKSQSTICGRAQDTKFLLVSSQASLWRHYLCYLVSTKLPPNNVHKGQFHSSQTHKQLFSHFFIPSLFHSCFSTISHRMAITHVAASAHRGGGNRGPAFMDYEINNFLDILGDVMPIGPLEWALVVDHHKVLFGNKNRDMQSLQRKFNALAGTTPSTGDAVIPPLVQKAKDVQRAIEIKMDSG